MTTWRPFQEVLQDALKNPEIRAEWDRTQLAREVSIWLRRYRKKHRRTQTELAQQLGWKQPMVARLESGEHEPSIATLHHLVERLGSAARIEIEPDQVHVRFINRRARRARTNSAPDGRHTGAARATEAGAETLQPA